MTVRGGAGTPVQDTAGRARKPVFSVVIDNYNYAEYLEEAIESVLKQSFPQEDVEIIVVDDGSTDDSLKRIWKYADKVTCIRKENGGQASALNEGGAKAKGDIIAFLDADDYWHPDKLQAVAREFERMDRVDFVYHYMNVVTGQHLKQVDIYLFPPPLPPDTPSGRSYLDLYLAGKLPWFSPMSGMVVRASCLKRAMPIPEEFRIGADLYLHYILPFFARELRLIAEPLGFVRLHGRNRSGGDLLTVTKAKRELDMLSSIRRHVIREAAVQGLDSMRIQRRIDSILESYFTLERILQGRRIDAVRRIVNCSSFLPEEGILDKIIRKATMLTYVVLPPSGWFWLQRRYRQLRYALLKLRKQKS